MQNWILISLLIFGKTLFSQDSSYELSFEMVFDPEMIGSSDCETGKNLAKRDIQNGKLAVFIHGYRSNNSETFERLMLKKYGIHAFRTGLCTPDELYSCYSSLSLPYIKRKFGEKIINETLLEAAQIDKSGQGDRGAYFKDGWEALERIMYCELSDQLLKTYRSKKNSLGATITLYVDKNGKIANQKIEYCEDYKVIHEIERIIKTLPILEPATKNGNSIADEIVFIFQMNKKLKRKKCQ